jgi:diacylglycerol kinase
MDTRRLLSSFKRAFIGLGLVIAKQQNFRVELTAAVGVIGCGLALGLNRFEFVAVLAMIVMVFFTEIVNTAFEEMLDAVSLEFNHKFAYVKDIMAGLVLVVTVGSVVVGTIIFYPYLVPLFGNL